MKVRTRLGALALIALNCTMVPVLRSASADIATAPASASVAESTSASNEYVPGEGFNVLKNKYASLNIGTYVLVRYLNQHPGSQTFDDHLGRTRSIDTRQDFQMHRALIHFRGFIFSPKLTHQTSVWAVNSTNSVTVISSVNYEFDKQFTLGGGIGGLPGTRSLNYEHPYFLGTDRQMADEFFRPSFTSGIWASGDALPKLKYRVMVGNNLNMVGISAGKLTRDFAYGGTVAWYPTTGEFGPKDGFGDFEMHDQVATRFGVSSVFSREDRQNDIDANKFPDNTSIRLSDSVNIFDEGSLAQGVSLQKSDYTVVAADASMKHRGFFLFGEYYFRRLGDFQANGALPLSSVVDHGYMIQAAYMIVPKKFEVYGANSLVFGKFNRPWEVTGGMNFFPWQSRSFRLNASVSYVDRSPTSSLFGYFVGGQKGPIASVSTDFFL